MEKVNILSNGFVFNKNINIDLSQDFDFIYENDIEAIVNEELIKAINPIVNVELKKYKPSIDYDSSITFSISGSTSYNVLFSDSEIKNQSPSFYNSVWIIDYYDSIDKQVQNKLYTQFYKPERKIIGYNQINTLMTFVFKANGSYSTNDYVNLYIPNNYINVQDIFVKIRFFCAKNGKLFQFKNYNSTNIYKQEDYYFNIKLDNLNNKWYISGENLNPFFINYENPLQQSQADSNANPVVDTNDNSSKGDFINQDGKYQQGDIINNDNC